MKKIFSPLTDEEFTFKINKHKIKIRRAWVRNPKTQIVESDKKYQRAREKTKLFKEWSSSNDEDNS